MGDVIPLKVKKGTAREQLLEMVSHQARVQGKSVAQYLRRTPGTGPAGREGDTALRPVTPTLPREKYVYLTRREVELFFDQIMNLRDRALLVPCIILVCEPPRWGCCCVSM